MLGLAVSHYINEIEAGLSVMMGREVFNRQVYYFNEIPVDVQASMVILVNIGALGIAVMASVIPAFRAACLHPVRRCGTSKSCGVGRAGGVSPLILVRHVLTGQSSDRRSTHCSHGTLVSESGG